MKYVKMSEAAKRRVSAMKRDDKGHFQKKNINVHVETMTQSPLLPPTANASYPTQFVAVPNPVNEIFYNPDVAFQSNEENASRMIQDMAIYSALQERQLATAALPWSIIPQDEDDVEQKEAADLIEDIIRNRLPNLPDFFRNFLDAIWFGRSACYLDYEWDFSTGRRQMVPVGWTPVHGDSLLFANDGRLGYRVGAAKKAPQEIIVSVEGQGVMVHEDDNICDGTYLSPADRKAWIVHHYQKTAGEFRLFQSAASIYGVGLRSRIYPIWLLKQSTMQFLMQNAEKFGAGWVIGYFDGGNPASANAVKEALQKQVGSCTQMFPKFQAGEASIEGMEVIDPPNGAADLLKLVEYYDKQIRTTICNENLTSENKGGTGLGSGLADLHATTFGRLVKYDSESLAETVTDQLVSVLQEFNDLDHLPPLKFEFSLDIESPKDKLEMAKILYDMGIKVSTSELLQSCGFTVPKESEITVNDGGKLDTSKEPIDTTGMEATNAIRTAPDIENKND